MRVGVLGALGRMGSEVCRTVFAAPDLELVAAVDPAATGSEETCGIHVATDLAALSEANVEAVVDFTHPDAAPANVEWCVDAGIDAVVGTSGFDAAKLEALAARLGSADANVVVVPNFAIGAVLMMHFAELAAPHFDRAEIIELHHDGKADAPSGTATNTAERMQAAKEREGGWPTRGESTETVVGTRGGQIGDIRMHAVRLPGLVAHQEVILGTQGQTLTLRHDSYDRSSFMPGVVLALRHVASRPGLTVGLEPLLGLEKT